ncbi:MAG: response regulator [Pseudomonadota bacterium]
MASPSQEINLLLVEDDEDDYLFTKEYLSEVPGQTYNITWVGNYTEGLRTISSQPFDVTLVDYRIDTGTGLEFIRMMRARNIDCPAILLTGVRSREVDVAAQQAGASDYLVKGSLNSEILERSIRYAIAHAGRRQVLDSVLANIDAAVIALDAHDGVMLMNAAARSIVGLDEIGEYAPDNSIGIYSNVRRFLGEAPYPSRVFDAKGRAFELRTTPLVNDGKLIMLREPSDERAPQPTARVDNGATSAEQGLTPDAAGAIYSWMEKVLTASKQLTQQRAASTWQQFAAEFRHSGRRLVQHVHEVQKLGTQGSPAPQTAPGDTPVATPRGPRIAPQTPGAQASRGQASRTQAASAQQRAPRELTPAG